jgi:hypothetical protein
MKIAAVLKPLGRGEEVRIDRRGADGGPDLTHRFAHRVKKCAAGVLHQMPAVGDLGDLRQGLGRRQRVAAAAGDDGNLRLRGKPFLRRRRLAVWKQGDGLAPLQIADDRSIALISPPSPVIDPDYRRRDEARASAPSHDAQQRVVAHRRHQPPRETASWPAAQGEPEAVDDVIESRRSSRPWRQHVLVKTFGEDSAAANYGVAMKPARRYDDFNGPVGNRQICHSTTIPTMDPRRRGPASRALAGFDRWSHCDHRAYQIITYAFNNETTRHQTRRSEGETHGNDSQRKSNASWRLNFIKIESDPISAPKKWDFRRGLAAAEKLRNYKGV